MSQRILGFILLALAVVVFGYTIYRNSIKHSIPLIFSAREVLDATWNQYKKEYLEPGSHRTLDKDRDNITTSEGQSYTLLRAVIEGDKNTFDISWKWTKDILQHPDDHLFSWLFGKHAGGGNNYGVLIERGGDHTASDADTDIALSLVFAYGRWRDATYMNEALPIIKNIWDKEVVIINGKPILTADNLEKKSDKSYVVINPSYFAPYAYRIFAQIDKDHDWMGLVDSSYDLISRTSASVLDKKSSANLPPNWAALDRVTAAVEAVPVNSVDSNFSYDALRTPWRLALDYFWNKDKRAVQVLNQFNFLSQMWQKNNALYTYTHDGAILNTVESPAVYGGAIGYFMVADATNSPAVYEQKLQYLYDPDRQDWKERLNYYDDNWAWFGIALYNGMIPPLRP